MDQKDLDEFVALFKKEVFDVLQTTAYSYGVRDWYDVVRGWALGKGCSLSISSIIGLEVENKMKSW